MKKHTVYSAILIFSALCILITSKLTVQTIKKPSVKKEIFIASTHPNTTQVIVNKNTPEASSANNAIPIKDAPHSASKVKGNPLDDPIISEKYNNWLASRGHMSLDPYNSYPHDTLTKLATYDHDFKAMMTLGFQSFNMDERKHWLELAAVYGYSAATSVLAWDDIPKNYTDTQKKEFLTNALVYRRVTELRNDYHEVGSVNIKYAKYKQDYGIDFSEDEKAQIETEAQKTYDRLENQRIQLGLGKFDNTIPPEVEAVYKAFEDNGIIKRQSSNEAPL